MKHLNVIAIFSIVMMTSIPFASFASQRHVSKQGANNRARAPHHRLATQRSADSIPAAGISRKILRGRVSFNMSNSEIKESTVPNLLNKIEQAEKKLLVHQTHRRKVEQAKKHQDKILEQETAVDEQTLIEKDREEIQAFHEQARLYLQSKREGLAEMKIRYVEEDRSVKDLDVAIANLENAFNSHVDKMNNFKKLSTDTDHSLEPLSSSIPAFVGQVALTGVGIYLVAVIAYKILFDPFNI